MHDRNGTPTSTPTSDHTPAGTGQGGTGLLARLRASDWQTAAGLSIVGAAAIAASFTALEGLARYAGWDHPMTLLLPLTVDVYGGTATRIWLAEKTPDKVKAHARWHAMAALVASVAGNGIYHALEAGALDLGTHKWLLVVAVSIIPPIALAALFHLIGLRTRETAVPQDKPSSTPVSAVVEQAPAGEPLPAPAPVPPAPVEAPPAPASNSLEAAAAAYKHSLQPHLKTLSQADLREMFGLSKRDAALAQKLESDSPAEDDEPEPEPLQEEPVEAPAVPPIVMADKNIPAPLGSRPIAILADAPPRATKALDGVSYFSEGPRGRTQSANGSGPTPVTVNGETR